MGEVEGKVNDMMPLVRFQDAMGHLQNVMNTINEAERILSDDSLKDNEKRIAEIFNELFENVMSTINEAEKALSDDSLKDNEKRIAEIFNELKNNVSYSRTLLDAEYGNLCEKMATHILRHYESYKLGWHDRDKQEVEIHKQAVKAFINRN